VQNPQAITPAAAAWGLQCLRYEIKDILPPRSIVQAMELQVRKPSLSSVLSGFY